MAEIQRQRIKSIYGEIAGLLVELPNARDASTVPVAIANQYNAAVDELTGVSGTDYSRHRAPYDNDRFSITSNLRTRIASLVRRLEEEHGFGQAAALQRASPVVVTVYQNQQVSLSITPIQQVINSTQDDELKEELEALKQAVEVEKNPKKASSILNTIQKKSWEVFIAVLPVVLEHLGKH